MSRAVIDASDVTWPQARMTLNSFNPVAYFETRKDEILSVAVPDAAAFLDEHVPGWASRITRPLNLSSVDDCVLGQVFGDDPPSRRFFGLLPPKKRKRHPVFDSGFWKGSTYLVNDMGLIDRPFVFSSAKAIPYWGAEIDRRTT